MEYLLGQSHISFSGRRLSRGCNKWRKGYSGLRDRDREFIGSNGFSESLF
jgi:hypothetical protein